MKGARVAASAPVRRWNSSRWSKGSPAFLDFLALVAPRDGGEEGLGHVVPLLGIALAVADEGLRQGRPVGGRADLVLGEPAGGPASPKTLSTMSSGLPKVRCMS